MLYAFFWVITRRLNFICRRLGTLCLFHLHRQVECSETSAYKIETAESYPEESIQQYEALFVLILKNNGTHILSTYIQIRVFWPMRPLQKFYPTGVIFVIAKSELCY